MKSNILGHFFMFTLLLLIVMLYVKNNYFLYTSDGAIFIYLLALALPVLLLVIFGITSWPFVDETWADVYEEPGNQAYSYIIWNYRKVSVILIFLRWLVVEGN